MKSILYKLLLVSIFLVTSLLSHASPGDTLKFQTFTFGSPQNAWFVFPSDTMRTNKILMYYTLKCNPAQSPACGEWDYQTSTYLYEHTGLLDSNLLIAPSYKVNDSSPDSLQYMFHSSWQYSPHFNTNIVYTATTSFDSTYMICGTLPLDTPFNTAYAEGRTQYLWKAGELSAAGLHPGDISGIRFELQSLGSQINNLTIRIKQSSLDSLKSNIFENTGFTTVYNNNTNFSTIGWNSIHFINPFIWNGSSNIVIDISFDNGAVGIPSIVSGSNPHQPTNITSAGNDKSLFCMGSDFVNVPKESMAAIDSSITVSCWVYGNPPFQPQNQSLFEAFDSLGHRVFNVHLPWSNSNIYWDAGNSLTSSYDRINKAATADEIEGQWNYWAFTKNVGTESLKIYKNGQLWHSGTGFTRRMYGITSFNIGSNGSGTSNFDGNIDEFAVWNVELDSNTIRDWMYKDLDTTHPYHNNLKLYYKFNDNTFLTAADSASGGYTGALNGLPTFQYTKGSDIVRNFNETTLRPNIIFEQGMYVSHIDTLITIDSVQTDPIQIYFYSDSIQPLVCTDTMLVWPTYYDHYVYDHLGIATDSILVTPDSVIYLKHWYYYGPSFEVINRYELQRFITPYGNNLSLGNGFTWVCDVSDYRTLLHDSVHLAAGNWQELLDLRFEFIKGIPPRDPQKVQNLWNGNFNYGYATDPIEARLTPKKVFISSQSQFARLKSRITGHGMDSPENCAEFCPKNHYFLVNGTLAYQRLVWRDDCSLNPVYPQGGTWIYSRSNWCPGADVRTYDLELTPFLTPNDTTILDHDVEPYTHTGGWSYYEIEDQLITYGAANFSLDAELYEIITPSIAQIYSRKNPICNNPLVTIRNTGSTPLTSLNIIYGVEGSGTQPSVFHWQGNLKFMEMENVTLGQVQWTGSNGVFYATVSAPNGGTDMYPFNNTVKNTYNAPPEFPYDIVIEFKTNNNPNENYYILKDDIGNVVFQRDTFAANTNYKDTVHLANGCYDFTLYDTDGDGLSFWNPPEEGTGYIRIRKTNGLILKTWNAEFGSEADVQFTVGYYLNHEEMSAKESIELYPNPSSGQFTLDIVLPYSQKVNIIVYDYQGRQVLHLPEYTILEKQLKLDLNRMTSGLYFVNIRTEKGVVIKKLIMEK